MASIAFLVLIAAVAAVAAAGGARRRGAIDWAAATRRIYLYGIALVALGMLVSGLAGLLELSLGVVVEVVGPGRTGTGEGALRGRLSFSAALAAIGLVAWLVHWWLAERPVRGGHDEERGSTIRRLFLYTILLIGGGILTLALRELVGDLLRLVFGTLTWSAVHAGDLINPLSLLGVTAVFWLYYARVARADRAVVPERDEAAMLRRWFVYGLCFFGLMLLLFGASGLLETLWEIAVVGARSVSVEDGWLRAAVATRGGSIVAGLLTWYGAWTWSLLWYSRADDPDPERRSALRKVFIYVVLAIAVGWTVWNLGLMLYGLVRTVLVPSRAAAGWASLLRELGGPLSAALVFGLAWRYHARVLAHEAADASEPRQATVRWVYGYLVALIGVLTLSVGLVGAASTLLDLLLQPGAARPSSWWQDQVSLYATLVAVGLPVWLAPWLRLQHEAVEPAARRSLARRIYLFLAFGIAVLSLLGSGAFALYQLFRLVLGERWTASQASELAWAASVAAVAGLMLAYHVRALRAGFAAPDQPAETAGPAPSVTLAVVRGASPAQLVELRRRLLEAAPAGVDVELIQAREPQS